MTVARLPVVGVLGSGDVAHEARARALGHWLARLGVHLLTGGGGGVMSAVSRAFSEVPDRRGLVIGVVPSAAEGAASEARQGYPNPWVEITVFTHLHRSGRSGTDPMSRNHINVLSSNVLVALPGGSGTASEISLALRYDRPVIAYLRAREEIPDLPDAVRAEDDLEKVKEFVRGNIDIGQSEELRGTGHRHSVE
jgi:uncharacterized protein (TIGR00725 family)